MKITKEHVGKRVKNLDWDKDASEIVALVYKDYFIGEDIQDEEIMLRPCDGDWEILPDPKPQGAPALFRINRNPKWATSSFLYTSREEAERELSLPKCDIIWPAIPDPKTGMYTLPED